MIKAECNHDFPDCCEHSETVGNGECDYQSHTRECNFDTGDCSQCKTNEGASPNLKCIFPFFYNGKNQTTCTWDSSNLTNNKSWCSTLVDESGNHVGGKWGDCGPECPIPPDNQT